MRKLITGRRVHAGRMSAAGLVPLVAALGLGGPTDSVAEDNAGASVALEEILVTARKREESLDDTPVSITAFTGEAIQRAHIDQLDAIATSTPNMIFDNSTGFSGSNSAAAVYIRGIGQIDFALTTEPGVGIYLDGVYIAQSIGSVLNLVDIERVEVLRGPQGTLFGRNTIGGAVSVTSKLPDEKLHGHVEVTGGRFNRIDVRGSLNVPLSDTLYAKVSAASFNRKGFLDAPNAPKGKHLGDVNQDAARLALRFKPNDTFEANLAFDYNRQRENGVPNVLVATYDGASLAAIGALANPTSPTYLPPPAPLPAPSFVDLHNIVATAPLGEQGGVLGMPGVVPSPVFGQGTVTAANVVNVKHGHRANLSNLDLSSSTDLWALGLNMDWDLGWASLRSITSYRDSEAHTAYDLDTLPVVTGDLVDDFDVKQFSQEFQLTGDLWDGRVKWLAGLYHFKEKGLNLDDVEFTPVRVLSGAKINNGSDAGFAQLTFNATDKLAITGGIRYTHESKKFIVPDNCYPLPKGPATLFDGTQVTCAQLQTVIDPKFLNQGFLEFVNAPVFPAPGGRVCCLPVSDAAGNIVALVPGLTPGFELLPRGTTKSKFNEVSPHVNVAYSWTEDLMTYASYSKGFKSGGFVQRVFPPKSEVPAFDPETAAVFEVGFKWTFLDRRVRLNASAFHTDYKNLQIQVNDGIAPVTRNAAAADIDGVEAELTAIPAGGWLFEAGVGYLKAEYTELEASQNFVTDLRNLTLDSKLVNAPKWSGKLALQYSHGLPSGSTLIGRANWSFVDDVAKDALNFPELMQKGYSLLDLYLTFVSSDRTWELGAFGKNVTNERYIVSGFANGLTQGRGAANLGRPAEWGVSFLYRFGE
ncbi:MAG: TonB-dependent receptor [Steroidobacteraceae bacterium]